MRSWLSGVVGLFCGLGLCVSPFAQGSVVSLKDGTSIRGEILEKSGAGLKVMTDDGVQVIDWMDVDEIRDDAPEPPSSQAPGAPKGTVTVILKNGRSVVGMLVKSDDQRVVVRSGGMEVSLARIDIESIEEGPTQPAVGPSSGSLSYLEEFPEEVRAILEEFGKRLQSGLGRLKVFKGEVSLRIDPTGFPVATGADLSKFSAQAKIWAQQGWKFRLEFSAQESSTGQNVSFTMASDGVKALGRAIANGQEQYFSVNIRELQSMIETAQANQQQLQSTYASQMGQYSEILKSLQFRKAGREELPLGPADLYVLTIPTEGLPNVSSDVSTNMGSVVLSFWIGAEDDLLYKTTVGVGPAPRAVTLELTTMDLDPDLPATLFTIQVPTGVTPQDLGQLFPLGLNAGMPASPQP